MRLTRVIISSRRRLANSRAAQASLSAASRLVKTRGSGEENRKVNIWSHRCAVIAGKVDGTPWITCPGPRFQETCWRRLLFVAAIFVAIVVLEVDFHAVAAL